MTPHAMNTLLRDEIVVAVVRSATAAGALEAIDAIVRGGITAIEVTYSTPQVPFVLDAAANRYGDAVILGAGTLREARQAAEAVTAGARFLVSPGLDEEVLTAMLDTGAATVTGALTPTEVMRAQRLGSHVIKLFPASLGGPGYLRSLRGPFPDLALMPTGGVSPENLGEWLSSGACAVGAGSELCSAADIEAGRFASIEQRAIDFAVARAAARAPAT